MSNCIILYSKCFYNLLHDLHDEQFCRITQSPFKWKWKRWKVKFWIWIAYWWAVLTFFSGWNWKLKSRDWLLKGFSHVVIVIHRFCYWTSMHTSYYTSQMRLETARASRKQITYLALLIFNKILSEHVSSWKADTFRHRKAQDIFNVAFFPNIAIQLKFLFAINFTNNISIYNPHLCHHGFWNFIYLSVVTCYSIFIAT